MTLLNTPPRHHSLKLQENLRDIPYTVFEHLLTEDSILRPKQREAVNCAASQMFDKHKRAIAVIMPTGTGKTVILAQIIAGLKQDEAKGRRAKKVLIVTDSEEGIKNTRNKLKEFANLDAGVYYGEEKNIQDKQVIVTTYNSWQDQLFPVSPEQIDFTVLDEAHRGISDARLETLQKYENSILLALTASPTYDEERDLLNHFELAFKMTVPEAVEHGLICSFRNIALNSNIELDLDELSKYDDNFDRALRKEIKKEARNRIGVDYLIHGNHYDTGEPLRNIRGIVSCVDTEHAEAVAKILNEEYIKTYPDKPFKENFATFISGDSKNRDEILQHHQENDTQYLVYADLLNQNYDDKKIGVVLNLRLTESMVLAIQRGGRATRLDEESPGKIALIIDIFHKFKGKFQKQPLFYAHAIGSAALITREAEQIGIERSFGFSKILATRQEEAKAQAQGMRFDILTDEESILKVFDKNLLIVQKKDDELSAVDVAMEVGSYWKRVNDIFQRMKPLDDDRKLWIDPQKYDPENPITFQMMTRTTSTNRESRLLKKEELEKFKNSYASLWRKENFLTYNRISTMLDGVAIGTVQKVLSRMIPMDDHKENWIDPHYKTDSQPPIFRIIVKNHNGKDSNYLLAEDFDKLKATYFSLKEKQPDERSAYDISSELKTGRKEVSNILDRYVSLNDGTQKWIDPNLGEKSPAFQIYERMTAGWKIRCLHKDEVPAFQAVYFSYPPKSKNELSSPEIAKRLGKGAYDKVATILSRLQKVEGEQDVYSDPETDISQLNKMRIYHRRASVGIIRCLNEDDLDKFEKVYYYLNQPKQEQELGPNAIAKRYHSVSTGDIAEILGRAVRMESNPDTWIDPMVGNKPLPFEILLRHTKNKGTIRCIQENSADVFGEFYNLKRKEAKPKVI